MSLAGETARQPGKHGLDRFQHGADDNDNLLRCSADGVKNMPGVEVVPSVGRHIRVLFSIRPPSTSTCLDGGCGKVPGIL